MQAASVSEQRCSIQPFWWEILGTRPLLLRAAPCAPRAMGIERRHAREMQSRWKGRGYAIASAPAVKALAGRGLPWAKGTAGVESMRVGAGVVSC